MQCSKPCRGPLHRARVAAQCALLAVVISACTTAASPFDFDSATLHGVIVDENHRQIEWASIRVNDHDSVHSDNNGRFAIADVRRGEILVQAARVGYEPARREFLFSSRTEVLYVQLLSGRSYVLRAVEALDSGENNTAVRLARLGLNVLPEDPEALFVAALATMRTGDTAAARRHVEKLFSLSDCEAVMLLRADLSAIGANEP